MSEHTPKENNKQSTISAEASETISEEQPIVENTDCEPIEAQSTSEEKVADAPVSEEVPSADSKDAKDEVPSAEKMVNECETNAEETAVVEDVVPPVSETTATSATKTSADIPNQQQPVAPLYAQTSTQPMNITQEAEPTPEPKKSGSTNGLGKALVTGIVGALIGGGLVGTAAYSAFSNMGTDTVSSIISTTTSDDISTSAADDEDTSLAEQVAAKCLPSVVSVYTYQSTGITTYSFSSGTSSDSSDSSSTETMSGLGSGVILSSDGYIVTNAHVVSGASSVQVEVDGVSYDAEIVGSDTSTDIAVLKIDATDLTPIEFADSDSVTVGSWCMAIGSPYGYEKTVTTGIVSAVDRAMTLSDSTGSTVYVGMIQTDAAINSGNSGGALVNEDGQLIGINSVIASSSGSSAGIGFAISSDYVLDAVTQLIENGYVVHPQLGVTIAQSSTNNTGATIIELVSGSAAEEAGLQVGDIITSVDGEEISGSEDVVIAVRSHSVGDTITIEYTRNGVASSVEVTLKGDVDTSSSTTTSDGSSAGDDSDSNTSDDSDEDSEMKEFFEKLYEFFGGSSN